jgi:predicted Rossmann fold flavoprotein
VVTAVQYSGKTKQFAVETAGPIIHAKALVLATGGYARPDTGSTGDGFLWLTRLGHTVVPNSDSLVPVVIKEEWVKKLSGLTLSEVKVSVWAEGKKQVTKTGRILLTHFGVTGPMILNLSKQIGDLLSYETVELRLDLFPQYDAGEFKAYLKVLLQSNKKLQNALAEALPVQLVRELLEVLGVDGETPCHSVRKEARTQLLLFLKAVPLTVAGLLGSDKAIVSSGGVVLEEVDFRTMESKKVPRLYIVGDLLNINRPSGGYSLQLCWSTGYVAGIHAAKGIESEM